LPTDLTLFFTGIYGPPQENDTRFMCISFLRPGGGMVERFFRWDHGPGLQAALDHIELSASQGNNVYYCVSLLTGQRRTKDFLDETHCLWADLDTTPPSDLLVEPTYLIETSGNHFQAVWTLDYPVPFSTAEDFSRRIYHTHQRSGADSTWDGTRLLRVPGTPNFKYAVKGISPIVTVIKQQSRSYDLDEIDAFYSVELETQLAPKSIVLDYQQVEMVGKAPEILSRYHRELDDDIRALVYEIPDPDADWSTRLWKLEMGLFEAGLDIYEVFVVAKDAGCNKYVRENRPDADHWKELARARETYERKVGMVLTTEEIEEIDLLTPEEIQAVTEQPETFIDRFQTWASSRTDAPREFHLGGALMALSTSLSDRMSVQTSFGPVRPNLWIMLLANSTIARKTTSMKLSLEITDAISDTLLATDGSIEGMLTELGARNGQTSVFVRDEFTSFLAGAKKKDYMAGMLTDMCGLYDGSRVKRRLRKEILEVKNPIFLLFAGGVETKLLELLTHEDVTSGFIPRFIPVFGATDIEDLQPIGRSRPRSFEAKDALVEELRAIQDNMPIVPEARVAGVAVGNSVVHVDLSDEAWERLQESQNYLLRLADGHDAKDLLMPCTERLVVNVLKVSALIAASRQREVDDNRQMQVELDDLMLSLYYARGWLDHLLRIVTRVGRDPFDQETHKALEYITAAGEGGISKGHIMRQFRMSARTAEEVLGTLEEREEVVVTGGDGGTKRGAIYRATHNARTAKQVRVTAPMQVRRHNPATRSPS
jgi:hypothetical protein